MEVRNHRIDPLKLITRVNEDARPATNLLEDPIITGRDRLQCPCGRCTDRNDSPTVSFHFIKQTRRAFRHLIKFGMHFMAVDIVHTDGTERAKPDMKRDEGDMNTHRFQLLEQLLGKVQPGRRGGCRSTFTRVDRLISILVVKLLLNIRRQRHFPELIQYFIKIPSY